MYSVWNVHYKMERTPVHFHVPLTITGIHFFFRKHIFNVKKKVPPSKYMVY